MDPYDTLVFDFPMQVSKPTGRGQSLVICLVAADKVIGQALEG